MQRGLTQADVAVALKVSGNTVSGWEAGKGLSVKHWHDLCLLLKIPCEVMGEESSNFTNGYKFQINFLRQLGLCAHCNQKVEEAIDRYYGERDTFQKKRV